MPSCARDCVLSSSAVAPARGSRPPLPRRLSTRPSPSPPWLPELHCPQYRDFQSPCRASHPAADPVPGRGRICALIVVPEPAVNDSGPFAASASAGPTGPLLACRVLVKRQSTFGPSAAFPVPVASLAPRLRPFRRAGPAPSLGPGGEVPCVQRRPEARRLRVRTPSVTRCLLLAASMLRRPDRLPQVLAVHCRGRLGPSFSSLSPSPPKRSCGWPRHLCRGGPTRSRRVFCATQL